MASNKQKDPEEKGQEKIYPQKIYLKWPTSSNNVLPPKVSTIYNQIKSLSMD
jgi:hypothetical protein